jgi:hypothetical protein
VPLIECPRCDEADERHVGLNRCNLCECEFYVARTGYIERIPSAKEQAEQTEKFRQLFGKL